MNTASWSEEIVREAVSAVKQYQCEKCMLETVSGLVEHSDEIEVSAEVVNAEEVRNLIDEDYVHV